jgi:hypothetical protein
MNATAVNSGKPVPTWRDFQIGTGSNSTSAVVTIQKAILANPRGSAKGLEIAESETAVRPAVRRTIENSKARTLPRGSSGNPRLAVEACVSPPTISHPA